MQSHAYAAACRAQGLRALEKACPLLVPLVEEGWTGHPVTAEVIEIYLNELRAEAAALGMNPDTLVLGCTHYPLLRGFSKAPCSRRSKIIDSADQAQPRPGCFQARFDPALGDPPETACPTEIGALPQIPWRSSSGSA